MNCFTSLHFSQYKRPLKSTKIQNNDEGGFPKGKKKKKKKPLGQINQYSVVILWYGVPSNCLRQQELAQGRYRKFALVGPLRKIQKFWGPMSKYIKSTFSDRVV